MLDMVNSECLGVYKKEDLELPNIILKLKCNQVMVE